MKYLIVDDEFIAHEIIQNYCDLLPQWQLMKNCYDALEAMEYLRDHSVDIIFLDLNMPKLKGFDFLRTLSQPPAVIVTTAYKEFAIEGYELNIVDYLLKPFSFERFLKAVNKIAPPAAPNKTMLSNIEETAKTIFLRSDKKHFQVAIKDILYVESAGNYVKVVLEDQQILVRDKISELLHRLSETAFIRTHKSFAVAIKHIDAIEGNRIFIGEHQIPIGKLYKRNVTALLK